MTSLLYIVNQQITDPTLPNTSSSSGGLSLLGWFIGFVIAAGVLTLVAWPLLNLKSWTRYKSGGVEQLELDTLYNRLETEQLALDELEFDHEAGGLNENDYAQLKTNSREVITELEQEIQSRQQDIAEIDSQSETELTISQEREAALVKPTTVRGGTSVVTRPLITTNSNETETTHKRGVVKKALHCSECGTAFKPSDRFCVHCGAPLPVVCQDCGAELGPNDRFCAKCGATVRH